MGIKESALAVTTFIFALNVISLIFMIEYYFDIKKRLLFIALSILLLLYVRYFIMKREYLSVNQNNRILVLSYIVISFVSSISSAVMFQK